MNENKIYSTVMNFGRTSYFGNMDTAFIFKFNPSDDVNDNIVVYNEVGDRLIGDDSDWGTSGGGGEE